MKTGTAGWVAALCLGALLIVAIVVAQLGRLAQTPEESYLDTLCTPDIACDSDRDMLDIGHKVCEMQSAGVDKWVIIDYISQRYVDDLPIYYAATDKLC